MSRPIRYSNGYTKLVELCTYDERERLLMQIMDYVRSNRLHGDYLEFGVYECGTFLPAYHFSKAMGKNLENMKFYGFDSFEGLPHIDDIDTREFKHFSKGDYAYSLDKVLAKLKSSGVNMRRVRLVKGWYSNKFFRDIKTKLPIERAAVIWIDCDLYESTVPVLEFVKDYIQNGTILVFDDFYCFRGNPEQGEQKAFTEWLKKNKNMKAMPLRPSYWGGQAFIMRTGKN